MRQTLSPVRKEVFRLQPASSNTITRPAAPNIVSSVAITVLTCALYAGLALAEQRKQLGQARECRGVVAGQADPPGPLQGIAAFVPPGPSTGAEQPVENAP